MKGTCPVGTILTLFGNTPQAALSPSVHAPLTHQAHLQPGHLLKPKPNLHPRHLTISHSVVVIDSDGPDNTKRRPSSPSVTPVFSFVEPDRGVVIPK